ncbi:MAG TPA: ATP-binding cassette domain-containing protein, partial [Planctomycetia bacterium]|nr:ATP-binding cassette domain-containing protein [Planctomycetia bacterium]
MTAAAPAVEFENVSKRYGAKPAVDGLSLSLFAGEIFAFLGPNGAGKTTTIKLLCGLLKPTSGAIRIDGKDFVGEALELRRRLGYVPDQPFLYEKLTGREAPSMRKVEAVRWRRS